jgi:hypothetical protein
MRRIPLLLVATLFCAVAARAEVTGVEVKQRADVGGSAYEKIFGTIHFAVDPKDPRNAVIVDIDKAPKNAAGKVEFSADLYILKPKAGTASNGTAIVEVVNRGRKLLITSFNRGGAVDPSTDADLGDGFLMKQGFTLVWVGWEFDVRAGGAGQAGPAGGAGRAGQARAGRGEQSAAPAVMGITLPQATGVTGIARAIFIPNDRNTTQSVGDLAGYSPADATGSDTTLTVRDGVFGTPQVIARDKWQLNGNSITMAAGFEPGRTYELAYRVVNPPVAGLGLAAYRDTASWIRYATDSPAPVRHTIGFGSSQSGRYLREYLYQGFNTDENGRQVLDGVMAHIAGAARLNVNARWSTPTSLSMYTSTAFPFSDRSQRDPITGRTEGLLENDRARANQPKIFYTNTAVEYWGGGRAAALLHTTADGKKDLPPLDNTRIYFLTGSQHSPSNFPPTAGQAQQPANPVNYWWTMRALLVAMNKWVNEGTAPPPSRYPKLADGTLVAGSDIAFPSIPTVTSPTIVQPGRQDGKPIPLLVPQVDADGNEKAGVRSPEHAAPLATFTGWNFRSPSIGATSELVSLQGSAIPFAKTDAAKAAGDSRTSIAARYASREAYLAAVKKAAEQLVHDRYLLEEDVAPIAARAGEMFDFYTK